MSTDIVSWQAPDPEGIVKVVSRGAIHVFLYLTIPCMVLTFIGAYGFYRWSKWREQKEQDMQAAVWTQP